MFLLENYPALRILRSSYIFTCLPVTYFLSEVGEAVIFASLSHDLQLDRVR